MPGRSSRHNAVRFRRLRAQVKELKADSITTKGERRRDIILHSAPMAHFMESLTPDQRDTVHNLFSNDARLRLNTIRELRSWPKRRALALLGRLRKDDNPQMRARVNQLILTLTQKPGK